MFVHGWSKAPQALSLIGEILECICDQSWNSLWLQLTHALPLTLSYWRLALVMHRDGGDEWPPKCSIACKQAWALQGDILQGLLVTLSTYAWSIPCGSYCVVYSLVPTSSPSHLFFQVAVITTLWQLHVRSWISSIVYSADDTEMKSHVISAVFMRYM